MPLTFTGYKFFAEETWKFAGESQELNIFARTFLILCWNLLARCISVAGLMYNHICWKDDSMTIVFPTHKGDQEGRDATPKHVFANPEHPKICPILSLAIFVFTCGFRRSGSETTVFGDENDAESRFGTWLRNVCEKNGAVLREMGLEIKDIGTHSFRKGIASFLSGIPGGPSPISIYLRAGWSLGAVQKRYILEGQGGDQLCGRAATGLPLTSPKFSQLPAHFINKADEPILTESEWEDILPGYTSYYPKEFRPVIPYLLASLVHHRNFLDESLPANHPLRLQRVWTSGILSALSSRVYTGTGKNTTTNLEATGIPPHIVVANQIEELEAKIDEAHSSIKTTLGELPSSLKSALLENFAVQGVVPMTPSQLEGILREMFATYMSNNGPGESSSSSASASASATTFELTVDEFGKLWEWGDPLRQHVVPQGFEFPRCNIKAIWDLWWGGDRSRRITYYRRISPGYDLPASNKQYFSKAKFVIQTMLETCNVKATAVASMTVAERDALFERSFLALFEDILDPGVDIQCLDVQRFGDTSYCRLYDRLKAIENAGSHPRRRRRTGSQDADQAVTL